MCKYGHAHSTVWRSEDITWQCVWGTMSFADYCVNSRLVFLQTSGDLLISASHLPSESLNLRTHINVFDFMKQIEVAYQLSNLHSSAERSWWTGIWMNQYKVFFEALCCGDQFCNEHLLCFYYSTYIKLYSQEPENEMAYHLKYHIHKGQTHGLISCHKNTSVGKWWIIYLSHYEEFY